MPPSQDPRHPRSLSVILPAYNEEESIEDAVSRALAVLPDLASEYEVLIVNDGSTDSTLSRATELLAEHSQHIRVLSHTSNQGYGAALRAGFTHAKYDLVFYTDSDNQFDISELAYFLPLIEEYDMVIGFRVYRYDSILRMMASWTYNRLVRLLFRVKVRDIDCAFKLLRREAIDKLAMECTDFFIDTELVARARKWNFRIIEKGVRHYPRLAGETKVQASDIPRTFRTLVTMFRRIYFPSRTSLNAATSASESFVEVLPPSD